MHISLDMLGIIAAIIAGFAALYFPARANRQKQEQRNLDVESWRTTKELEVVQLKKDLTKIQESLDIARRDGQDDNNLILKGLREIRTESTEQHKSMRELLSTRTGDLHNKIDNLRKELQETNLGLIFIKGRLSVENETKDN